MAHPQTNFSSNFQGVDPPLEGYWHDDPIPCGSGNVVTDIHPNPAGVPVVVKGINALTVEDIANKLDNTGDASNTTATFSTASTRTNIASGEKLSVLFGKIAKWFGDLGTVAFKVLVTTWSGTPSDNNVPSEKLVKDSLDSKQDTLPSISGKAGKVLKVNSGATGLEWETDDNTTYSQISRGSGAGLAPGLPSGSSTTKFLREDGTWEVPNYPSVPSVINNLTSTSTTDALSAAQGKVLNETIEDKPISEYGFGLSYNVSGQYSLMVKLAPLEGQYKEIRYTLSLIQANQSNDILQGSLTIRLRNQGGGVYVAYATFVRFHLGSVLVSPRVYIDTSGYVYVYSYGVTAGWNGTQCQLTSVSTLDGTRVKIPNYVTFYKTSSPSASVPADQTSVYIDTFEDVTCEYGGKGSPSTPVYVDSNGQVQPCTQGATLKTNTATLYIAGTFGDGNLPYYNVKDIKNGCVNYVHVKDIPSNTCSITIEAPALASGEEYDYVVVFDTFTNSNLVGSIDVENCKKAGRFENNVFVVDTMALTSGDPQYVPMIIVTGNVASSKWYNRT